MLRKNKKYLLNDLYLGAKTLHKNTDAHADGLEIQT